MIENALAGVICFAVGFIIFYVIRAWRYRNDHDHRYSCIPYATGKGFGARCICDICGKEEVLT